MDQLNLFYTPACHIIIYQPNSSENITTASSDLLMGYWADGQRSLHVLNYKHFLFMKPQALTGSHLWFKFLKFMTYFRRMILNIYMWPLISHVLRRTWPTVYRPIETSTQSSDPIEHNTQKNIFVSSSDSGWKCLNLVMFDHDRNYFVYWKVTIINKDSIFFFFCNLGNLDV